MVGLLVIFSREMIEGDLSRFRVETRRLRKRESILEHLAHRGFARSCSTDEKNIPRSTRPKGMNFISFFNVLQSIDHPLELFAARWIYQGSINIVRHFLGSILPEREALSTAASLFFMTDIDREVGFI